MVFSKELRYKMRSELLDIGDTICVEYIANRFGGFDSFRQTIRYVARSIDMRIATERNENRMIITRLDPSEATLTFKGRFTKLGVFRDHVEFFNQHAHLLEPSPSDPLYEFKQFLMTMMPAVKNELMMRVEENEKDGLYNEKQ